MRVREATSGDASAVLALHREAILARGPGAYDGDQVAAWAERDDPSRYPIGDPNHEFVVCEVDDEVIAFGDLDAESGEIVGVYVHPEYDRRGVGTAVLERLETAAADRGHGRVELTASKNAVGFYERRGYERLEEVRHTTTDGVELDCVRMGKRLQPGEPL